MSKSKSASPVVQSSPLTRCDWCTDDPLYLAYHDNEWGRPCYEEAKLFELFILETQQAGLSWYTVLKKREDFRQAFQNFDPNYLAACGEKELAAWLDNPSLIRNRRKLEAVIHNAQRYCNEFGGAKGGFLEYFWSAVGGSSIDIPWKEAKDVPVSNPISDQLSADLKRKGFKFVGSITIYAYLQATGLINDHLRDCIVRTNPNHRYKLA